MKKFYTLTPVSLALILIMIMAGCGKKMTSATSNAVNLKYGFSGDESYSYLQESQIIQTIVFGGQEVSTTIKTDMGFTASSKGVTDGSLGLDITIDTLGLTVNSMAGNITEDIDDLKGKSFYMTMNTKGEDQNLDEAEKLTYTIAGMSTSNLKAGFIMIFPELPGENIQPGFTWEDTDTINIDTDTETLEMITLSKNTVESIEEVSGYECYKISYQVSGTRDGSSQTPQGMIITNSDISGTGYYYFAFKEGILVSDHSDIKSDGTVVIPTGESIPMYMTMAVDMKVF